jgi:hypothetical protein
MAVDQNHMRTKIYIHGFLSRSIAKTADAQIMPMCEELGSLPGAAPRHEVWRTVVRSGEQWMFISLAGLTYWDNSGLRHLREPSKGCSGLGL